MLQIHSDIYQKLSLEAQNTLSEDHHQRRIHT